MPSSPELITEEQIQSSIISYSSLLAQIGAPISLAHSVGKYLYEVADWCAGRGYPPINALAVNQAFGMPGTGYFLAPGGDDWESEIRSCIAYRGYPMSIV